MENEIISAKKFKKLKMKYKNNLIENILAPGITIVGGKPRVGKTNLALQIASSLSTKNAQFLNEKCLYTKVIYFSFDTKKEEIQKRLNLIPLETENLYLLYKHKEEFSFSDLETEIKIQTLQRKKSQEMLIVVDMMQNVKYERKYDINNYQDTYDMIKKYYFLAKKYDCNFILVHHVNKSSSSNDVFDSLNGSIGLRGAAENMLLITENNNNFELHIDSRYFSGSSISLKKDKNGFFELNEEETIILTDDKDLIELIKFVARANERFIEDTATNICVKANLKYTIPRQLFLKLENNEELLHQNNISFQKRRSNGKNLIKIELNEEESEETENEI